MSASIAVLIIIFVFIALVQKHRSGRKEKRLEEAGLLRADPVLPLTPPLASSSIDGTQLRSKIGRTGASTTTKTVRRTRAQIQKEVDGRDNFLLGCVELLNNVAIPHPAGHTTSVSRYVMRARDENRIDLMLERNRRGRAKLWISSVQAQILLDLGIEHRDYPASEVYKSEVGEHSLKYSRHAGLRQIRSLANADLVRFTIDEVEQLSRIVDRLKE